MEVWEQILLGIGAFIIIFFFWPGAKAALKKSKQVENPDWNGALIPIGAVVFFVILLILVASS